MAIPDGKKEHLRVPAGYLDWATAGVVFALAPVLVFFLSGGKAGVTPDSVAYLGAAESLLGQGSLDTVQLDGSWGPLSHFPPAYPLLLAGWGFLAGLTPGSFLALNAVLLSLSLLLLALLIRATTEDPTTTFLGTALGAVGIPTLVTFSHLWSETLFLPLLLGALWALNRSRDQEGAGPVALAGVMVAVAGLTRYLGMGLVPVGWWALWGRKSRRRGGRIGLFTVLALGPTVLWTLARAGGDGGLLGREPTLHLPDLDALGLGLQTLSVWLVPLPLPPGIRTGLAMAALGALFLVTRRSAPPFPPRLAGWSALALVLYVLAARALIDAAIPFDHRMLGPVYPLGILWALGRMASLPATSPRSLQRRTWPAVLGALVLLSLARPLAGPQAFRSGTRGYLDPYWQSCGILQGVRELPADTPILTNRPDALYFLSGRRGAALPFRQHPTSGIVNPDYREALREIGSGGESVAGTRVVLFFDVPGFHAADADAAALMELEPVAEGGCGGLFRIMAGGGAEGEGGE